MNEDELYRLAEAAYRAKVSELGIPQGPQRDSLWNGILDQLEAAPPEQLRQWHDEVFGAPQPGMMDRLKQFFSERTQNAARMDAEEGTTGVDRLATGAVYGAINAPHRLAKGVLGIGRMLGAEEPYNRYSEWSQGFEDDYNAVTPYLGKVGMAGEMVGSLPTDLPLYATGMGVASKVPAVGRMLARGGGRALAAEMAGNAGVDFLQNAVIGAGYEGATPGSMALDGAVGTALGGVANLGTAGIGATVRGARRAAGRAAGDRAMAQLPPDYIDDVVTQEYGRRPRPAPATPSATPVRPQSATDLLSSMIGRSGPLPLESGDVKSLADKLYANRFRRSSPVFE